MKRSAKARLFDILEAIVRVREAIAGRSLDEFEADWRARWIAERGVEIISEASRHLTDDLKERQSQVPWRKVAGIGNVIRHDYEKVAAPVIWKLATFDFPALESACQDEAAREDL